MALTPGPFQMYKMLRKPMFERCKKCRSSLAIMSPIKKLLNEPNIMFYFVCEVEKSELIH